MFDCLSLLLHGGEWTAVAFVDRWIGAIAFRCSYMSDWSALACENRGVSVHLPAAAPTCVDGLQWLVWVGGNEQSISLRVSAPPQ